MRRILDAATTILKERGYDGTSTNRIAAAAGISPGSLYQYFPNKDAILHTVVEEYAQDLLNRTASRLSELLQADLGVLVAAAIDAQVDTMLERPEILRMVCGQLPGRTTSELLKPLEELMTATIKGYTIAQQAPAVDMDLDAATWIVVGLLGTTVRYVVDEPPIAKDVFVAEMTRLVLSHPLAWCCATSAAATQSMPTWGPGLPGSSTASGLA
ncbi:TetR/AcrR family transcriptional regulator [Mycobacterium decipiens]|uniref:TetR/AcrR family transcriptional regulator n=1 Tax=Mycobacterium decipiens TaxID=1430326 RepID=UPI001F5FF81D|nr:TetR/AcrR family transcriptional regulator [Mycobacterium decipiens]